MRYVLLIYCGCSPGVDEIRSLGEIRGDEAGVHIKEYGEYRHDNHLLKRAVGVLGVVKWLMCTDSVAIVQIVRCIGNSQLPLIKTRLLLKIKMYLTFALRLAFFRTIITTTQTK